MIAHCTAASLGKTILYQDTSFFFKYVIPLIVFCFQIVVSENKVLCHPASIDSLTTSAGTEDHVSMGGFAARKCLRVVEHVEQGQNGFSYECRLNLVFFFT